MSRRLSDPLARALAPPPDETPASRDARVAAERAAKQLSDRIDETLRAEAERKRKAGRIEVKVLLLGQSESGKSTTLKQFQLMYTPNAFREERLAWRSIVYINIVRSVRLIIETLSAPDPAAPAHPGRPSTTQSALDAADPDVLFDALPYAALRDRLAPLLALEDTLIGKLAADGAGEATRLPPPASSPTSDTEDAPPPRKSTELAVRTGGQWKKALRWGRKSISEPEGWWKDPTDPAHVLHACRGDMQQLWADERVRAGLRAQRIRPEESSGFYLDDLERVTALEYVPSDDDVLKARLKTVGIVEHTFALEKGNEKGCDWKIYDVGGARNQRQAWAPYFDSVDAIIFLAPISAFDQVLAEDRRVNRLEDSLLLWRSLVSNRLLKHVNIVLFLNKCDLLQAKLAAGVQLNVYMTSYGERANDYETVSKYFKSKFNALHRSYSPNQDREVYVHLTSVTDTAKTASIITNVRDLLLRDNLKDSRLL